MNDDIFRNIPGSGFETPPAYNINDKSMAPVYSIVQDMNTEESTKDPNALPSKEDLILQHSMLTALYNANISRIQEARQTGFADKAAEMALNDIRAKLGELDRLRDLIIKNESISRQLNAPPVVLPPTATHIPLPSYPPQPTPSPVTAPAQNNMSDLEKRVLVLETQVAMLLSFTKPKRKSTTKNSENTTE